MEWTWIRSRAQLQTLAAQSSYAKLLEELREHVDFWKAHFKDDPSQKTGWLHNYVCPTCGEKLLYNPQSDTEYLCPVCKEYVASTPLIKEAWIYLKRFEIENMLLEAAALYAVYGDPTDYDFVVRVVDFYAGHYAEFDEYGRYAGRGRIMGQSLDEAVWGVNVMRALMLIGFDGKSEQGRRFYKQLFLPMSRLVVAQSGAIHNIPLWHATCAFCAGIFFGDEWLVSHTLDGDLGLRNQILKGFTDDGIWYENSTGYHFYSAMASTNACLFARWTGRQDEFSELFARVIKAYTAVLRLRFRNGALPAFNDCNRDDSDHAIQNRLDLYTEAAHVFAGMPGAQAIADVVGQMEASPSLGTLLFETPQAAQAVQTSSSVHLAANCLATLRNESIEVFCKYGNLCRSHAHADSLEISIPPFSFDPGNPNYGSVLCSGFYRQTLAHSTFLIDGKSQSTIARGEATMSDDGRSITMEVKDAYPGVSARRTLLLDGCRITDTMQIECNAPHVIDWVFHSDGDAAYTGDITAATLPDQENGYAYLQNVRQASGDFRAAFVVGGKKLSLAFDALPKDASILLARSPGNPSSNLRHTTLVRAKNASFQLIATYEISQA